MRYLACMFVTLGLLSSAWAQTAPGEINARRANQQQRIANGVRSGQLTPGETARLEGREARVNHEIRRDRMANGGRLTGAEKGRINRQQNRISRSIYRDKHNAAVAPR